MNEQKVIKMNILGGMNELIKNCGEKDLQALWNEVIPLNVTEDNLKEIAEDDFLYHQAIRIYVSIESELYRVS